jgi:hypothetical protein
MAAPGRLGGSCTPNQREYGARVLVRARRRLRRPGFHTARVRVQWACRQARALAELWGRCSRHGGETMGAKGEWAPARGRGPREGPCLWRSTAKGAAAREKIQL